MQCLYLNIYTTICKSFHHTIPFSLIYYTNIIQQVMSMQIPDPLKPNDTIGLIAPCSPIPYSKLIASIQCINSLGYKVALGNSATCSLYGYLAGSDEIRANDINSMFENDDINAIFCLRGGYGSTSIMEFLDYEMIRKHPKIFVGYSDITSYHLAFYTLCDLITFHGPMVSSNMVNDFDFYTKESFYQALSMPEVLHFENPTGYPMISLVPGCAEGRVIGGCLSLVSPALSTFYQPDFCNTILFLEDIDETLPRCDKMMYHLKNAGIFDRVNGVLLGNFKGCENPNAPSYSMLDFFQNFFCDYDKPVLYGIQSGHDKPMGTIPFGTVCNMDSEQCSVCFRYCP